MMAVQRIFLVIGGPHDGMAFRPIDGVPREGQVLELEGHDYAVTRVPRTRDNLMVSRWVLLHGSMAECDVVWQAFMATMRAWAAEVLR